MNRLIGLALLSFLFLIGCKNSEKDLKREWEKIHATKQESLEKFSELKFGMFIHWGLYSIPAGIWEDKKMEEWGKTPHVAEWIQYVAEISRKEYALLADKFNPVKFNADSIVMLAKDAGMKYMVITAKHHEGFAMYHSNVSRFNVVDATPYKRDIIEELYHSCKRHGIEFGIYYSHARDWADDGDSQYTLLKELEKQGKVRSKDNRLKRPWGANTWDPKPVKFDDYLKDKAIPQVKELLEKFPDIFILWYDASTYILPEQSFKFYKIPYEIQPQVLINNRIGPGIHYIDEKDYDFGDYNSRGDNRIPDELSQFEYWEACGTTNNSWGYKSYDDDYKSVREQLWWLINITSKGGNYLLNVSPTAEGVIPEQSVSILSEVGKWMKSNGEAIYGTTGWRIHKEGPTSLNYEGTSDRRKKRFFSNFSPADFWFTSKGNNNIYAIALEKPSDGVARIKSLKIDQHSEISYVELVSTGEKLSFQQSEEELLVELPNLDKEEYGYALKIRL
jgi:alpha-L-fucosidase